MRKPVKTIKNLQKRDYVNMYIVYLLFLKNFEILRNIAIICKKLPPATPEGIIRYKLGTGVALFLFAIHFEIFRNFFQNLSKEMHTKIFRKIAILSKDFASIAILSKDFWHAISFERFRIFILLMMLKKLKEKSAPGQSGTTYTLIRA